MQQKAYIVICYGGQWEDSFSFPKKVYLDEEKAKLWVEKANKLYISLFQFYKNKYDILSLFGCNEENIDKWEIYMNRCENYDCAFRVEEIEITN